MKLIRDHGEKPCRREGELKKLLPKKEFVGKKLDETVQMWYAPDFKNWKLLVQNAIVCPFGASRSELKKRLQEFLYCTTRCETWWKNYHAKQKKLETSCQEIEPRDSHGQSSRGLDLRH